MNFLAHAYLSDYNSPILAGNLIADFIRGKQIDCFPSEVQAGIRLHRQIDSYTDAHPVVKEAKRLFAPSAHRYAGSFLDVSFDHFLALDKENEPNEGWLNFSLSCYVQVDAYVHLLHPDYQRFFNFMKTENWLYNYRHKWLIEKNFTRMKRHLKFLEDNADVYGDFEGNYNLLQNAYDEFFPDLIRFVRE